MDVPIFSQIPQTVLSKCIASTINTRAKRVKFYDNPIRTTAIADSISLDKLQEVTSGSNVQSTDGIKPPEPTTRQNSSNGPIKSNLKVPKKEPVKSEADTEVAANENASTHADAIVQADFSPQLFTKATQTDDVIIYDSHEDYASDVVRDAGLIQQVRPLYPTARCKGGRMPPLKVGLCLPKGKKRKVYYPGQESDSD